MIIIANVIHLCGPNFPPLEIFSVCIPASTNENCESYQL